MKAKLSLHLCLSVTRAWAHTHGYTHTHTICSYLQTIEPDFPVISVKYSVFSTQMKMTPANLKIDTEKCQHRLFWALFSQTF